MTVLNIAYPLAPVRPDTAGGAEQVLAMLDRALVAAGYRSLVVACQGSVVQGTLIATEFPGGPLTPAVTEAIQTAYRAKIAETVAQYRPNLIHLHGIDFPEYLPPPGVPAIATLHLPPGWYPPGIFATTRPNTYVHCVSESQRRACPQALNLLPTIENGVAAPNRLRPIRKRNYAAVLGRICPEKGVHSAIQAARIAKIPLLIAGQVFPYEAHTRYFDEQVRPLLDGRCARFLGAIGPRAKDRLLSSAACVLVPSTAPETSSLVAMEAAMCGTPVVAFASGALPEIVEHGRTGFLVRNEIEMAQAIGRCAEIEPADCRAVAQERFAESRAQAEYLAMYRRLAQ